MVSVSALSEVVRRFVHLPHITFTLPLAKTLSLFFLAVCEACAIGIRALHRFGVCMFQVQNE